MKVWIIYNTEPEPKVHVTVFSKVLAENILAQRQQKERAGHEAAATDADGEVKAPTTNYANAKVKEIELD